MSQFKLPMFESNYTFNKEDALRQEQERIALENEKNGLQYNPSTGTWTKSVVKTVQPRPDSYWNKIASQYGFKDMQAVKDWQTKNGLVADGKFGKNSLATWNSLQNKQSTKNEISQQQTSPSYWNNYQPNTFVPTSNKQASKQKTTPKSNPVQATVSRYTMNNTVGGDFGIGRGIKNAITSFLNWLNTESGSNPNNRNRNINVYGKYQQGGTMNNQEELQKAFLQFLVQDAAAQGVQIQSEQDLQAYAQQLGEEGIKAKYQEFMQKMQGGTMAKLGAKLEYIKKLKGVCPEGYEMSYYKVGGRICKACQKMHKMEAAQKGKKLNAVQQFKKDMKTKDEASRDSIAINKWQDQDVMTKKGNKGTFKKGVWTPDRKKYK